MKLREPDKVAFETGSDYAMGYCEAQTDRADKFWNVLEADIFGVDDPPEGRSESEIMEAHLRIRKDTLDSLAKYADAIAQKRTFPLPSGIFDQADWESVKFILAFNTSFDYFPEDEDGAISEDAESDYLDYETSFRYDVVKACKRLALEGAALAKHIGSATYGLWTAAMIKLNDCSEEIQHKAADDMVNALIQTWADLEVWIFMNTPHNGKKHKPNLRKPKK